MDSGSASAHQHAGRRVGAILADPPGRIHSELAAPGHAIPDVARLRCYDLAIEGTAQLIEERHGVHVVAGGSTQGNVLALDRELRAEGCSVRFSGSGATVILGQNAVVSGKLVVGDDARILVAGQPWRRVMTLNVTLFDRGERLYWGSGSSAEGFHTSVKGEDAAIVVADDCMFSWGVWVRPFDMHVMIDPISGECVNPPADVIVGPHVWVGQNALLLRGSRIGGGGIVGANAVVTRGTYEPLGLHVGQPARTIKTGLTWDRDSRLSADAVRRAREVHARYAPQSVPDRGASRASLARLERLLAGWRTGLQRRRARP